jgi:hypothetical protein
MVIKKDSDYDYTRITDENIDKYYKEKPDTINKTWKVIKVAYTGNSLSKKASNTVSKNLLIISDSDLEKSMVNSGEFVIVNKHLQHVNVYQKALKELNK